MNLRVRWEITNRLDGYLFDNKVISEGYLFDNKVIGEVKMVGKSLIIIIVLSG